ncbi:ArsR/SmtB family transcription factor [Actinopolymorpha rutila]|uniref:DNA-binding transcriptional ArsR family regulator n=1 Tax=Actinopolymorpha rutila TaxID=446787 RepID=A0A852ZJ81_9ACTN|nr:helix-turn-helix domain-containing protein [Actinopolymorpha rutila]NYH93161.1 DNA-binding transcriptional ArsR family regulator [Actinopolymorpha rutila]
MPSEIKSMRAVAHPVRLRMLSLLTGAAMSAAELAQELDITHANASYHLRLLVAAGMLEPAGEENVRGGVAKRYRYLLRAPGTPGSPGSPATTAPTGEVDLEQLPVWQAIADELVRRAHHQVRTEHPVLLTDAELWVEPETWQQVVALAAEASNLLHTNARRARTSGTMRVNATMALFELARRENRR